MLQLFARFVMNDIEKFQQNNYVIARKLISDDLIQNLDVQFRMFRESCHYYAQDTDVTFGDSMFTENAFCWYAPVDQLLITLKPKIEKLTGLELTPAYSFGRIYSKNAVMEKHTDRPACEISMTLTISFDKEPWPIWVENKDEIAIPVMLYPGDAMIYRGEKVPHWRNEFTESEEQVQFFLHWIDSNGPNMSEKFDKRPILGIASQDHL